MPIEALKTLAADKNAAKIAAKAHQNGQAQQQQQPYVYHPNANLRDSDTINAPDFPLDVLPAKHVSIIDELHKYLAYPRDFTAVSMLAATAVAAGRTHEFQNGLWNEGCCLYLGLVAPPGTMKSHPLEFALMPCIEANKRAIREYTIAKNLQMAAGSAGEVEDRQFIYSDFTIETLTRALKKHPRGVAVYIDELKAWIQNFNRYNSGSEQEFWLMNWSGKTIALNRSGYKAVLDRTDVPVIGTIQPGLLEDIGKGGRNLSGFIERILFCFPDHVPVVPFKKRKDRQFDIYRILQARYNALLTPILDYKLEISDNDGAEVRQLAICDEPAEDRLIDFLNDLKRRMDSEDNEYVRNIYSKMQTYACRFVLVLQLMHEVAGEVTDRTFHPNGRIGIGISVIEKAVKLTEYFLIHSLKAQNQINSATPLDRLPRNIRLWYAEIPSGQEVSTEVIESITAKHGLSRATMFNYLGEVDPRKKLFLRARHGYYEKLYHQ